MIALLLAAALVGPPAPQAQSVPVERIADDMATHISLIAAGYTTDMVCTGIGMERGRRELNPSNKGGDIGLIAWRTGTAVGVGVVTYWLERKGHHGMAKWLSLGFLGASTAVGVNNCLPNGIVH